MSRPSPRGRLKAVAVDFVRLYHSPSTGRTQRHASFLPTLTGRRVPSCDLAPLRLGAVPPCLGRHLQSLRVVPTLNWIGKDAVVRHHKEVPFRLLEADPKRSHGDPASGNLIVEGDNLHALKALLPRYAGKVKCICIDPPYNTGNEGWVYNDNVNAPEILRWLGQTVGKEAEDLSRHDKWLCMMYPRLVLLRQFLADRGVIVINIDENELPSLLLLMDEIFGRSNRLGEIVWNKGNPKGDSTKVAYQHETVVVYARSAAHLGSLDIEFTQQKPNAERILSKAKQIYRRIGKKRLPDEISKMISKYDLPKSVFLHLEKIVTLDDAIEELRLFTHGTAGMKGGEKPYYRLTPDGRVYRLISMAWPNKKKAPDEYFEPIVDPKTRISYPSPKKGWRYPPKTILSLLKSDLIEFPNDQKTQPQRVLFLTDNMEEKIPSIVSYGGSDEDFFSKLGLQFDFQKPYLFVQSLLAVFAKDKDSIILDTFAGSGTTAHAVLKQNAEDGGNRKFILVEMEPHIARDITAERVHRVAGGYTNAKGEQVEGLGGGFQYCRLSKEPLFDATGAVRDDVTFAQLAEFVWFAETGTGFTGKAKSPLLGVHEGVAVYLLYNGILKDRAVNGGNVLTAPVLALLPPHAGPKVIYAAANRLGAPRLQRDRIVFKQTPYALDF